MRKIGTATESYEKWVGGFIRLNKTDLRRKHDEMAGGAFAFLRATFYRWAQIWPELRPRDAAAPEVWGVGDLHVENFGTWRDAEGRLVWGVNDFDEAAPLPYTSDLTRLATSALIAIRETTLHLSQETACNAIRRGYENAMAAGGEAFVLAERHDWLRDLCTSSLRDPVKFWKKMDELKDEMEAVPDSARVALERLLPRRDLEYKVKHRLAGLGSRGRPRFVALTNWQGGRIAREAKALLPSAVWWASGNDREGDILYQTLLDRSVRCRDPFVSLEGTWIVRRLAPDCSRIELSSLPKDGAEERLLEAMGWETANIHLARPETANAIHGDLAKRKEGWLISAATEMRDAVQKDFEAWRESHPHPKAAPLDPISNLLSSNHPAPANLGRRKS